jgi:hypothetical protein
LVTLIVTCSPFLASGIQPSRLNVQVALSVLLTVCEDGWVLRPSKLSLVAARMGLRNYVWDIMAVIRHRALVSHSSLYD